ncbi:queuosine precursor transporter [Fluviicola chungangensis]|uniref:Probable queuosine precursor transporter n=1 Tax=Fluviicola chungangensis TaxID=2597671 RepID=A0A556N164_9FLAO|nr:queuosine precursor transporter [Fluviicola chungangensis]TSJ45788.1 queuosine precursor transporter [Fluviicola chungangensis]
MLRTRKELAFMVMAGIFITSAIVAELISAKLVYMGPYLAPMIAGIVPWPIVFLLTDVMNEYFGKQAIRRLSWITTCLIAFCFLIVFIAVHLPTAEGSWLSDQEFAKAFGGSLWIMVGSITAFLVSQLLDVQLFHFFSKLTKGKMIWLRSTGSTVVSQLVDSFIVAIIGLYLSGAYPLKLVLVLAITGYLTKLVIAVCLTPLIYVMHYLAKRILGERGEHIIPGEV